MNFNERDYLNSGATVEPQTWTSTVALFNSRISGGEDTKIITAQLADDRPD